MIIPVIKSSTPAIAPKNPPKNCPGPNDSLDESQEDSSLLSPQLLMPLQVDIHGIHFPLLHKNLLSLQATVEDYKQHQCTIEKYM